MEEEIVPALGIMLKLLMEGAGGKGGAEEELGMVAKIMRFVSMFEKGRVVIVESKGVIIPLRLAKLENALV